MKSSVDIILPNQLFENSNLTENSNPKFLVEEEMFFNQYKFHKQKLLFHRMTMKNYENYLVSKGFEVTYIDSKNTLSKIIKLISYISKKYKKIEIIDPNDYLIERRIKKECDIHNVFLKFHDSKLFINKKSELSSFFNPLKKKFFQT